MNNYTDDLNRVHTQLIRPDDNFPTNNAWIYTGIHETLRKMNDKDRHYMYWRNSLDLCRVSTGLYSRHPAPYRFSPNMTAVSHDEIIGISMISKEDAVAINIRSPYFCDIPKYETEQVHSLIEKLRSAQAYLYRVVIKKESQRRTTKDYPALFGIFFSHRRQYRYIYEVLSRMDRHTLNALAWSSSRLLDSLTNSVSMMHYMVTIRMQQKGVKSKLVNFIKKSMERSIIRKYGTRPIEKLLEEYLLNGTGIIDKQHPWLIEIREYYENKGE